MAVAKKRIQRRKAAQPVKRHWVSQVATTFTLLLLGGVLAGAYVYLSQPGRMPLRVVEVAGVFRHLDRAAIRDTAGRAIDGGFFSCDMQKLRDTVLAMPWVADVSIRRVWPDRLSMHVVEQVPLARWGGDALVSVEARVFRPDNLDDYADLIGLSGPQGSARRVVAFFESALPAVRNRELAISEIELDQRRHWWVRFDDGLTVSLGQERADLRLAQFLRVYPQLVADPSRRPARVDMRYAHGFAVRWREPDTDTAKAAATTPQEKV